MNNNNLILILLLLFTSCQTTTEEKDYLSISGKINDFKGDSIIIQNFKEFLKVIPVNSEGVFSDTLKLPKGQVFFVDAGNDQFRIYARNGLDIHLAIEPAKETKIIEITGDYSENLNYFQDVYLNPKTTLFSSPETAELDMVRSELDAILIKEEEALIKNVPLKTDTSFNRFFKEFTKKFRDIHLKEYDEHVFFKTTLGKGTKSPNFVDYANANGGLTSLKDLEGKYAYIDVWATWCKPCIAEFPYIAKLKAEYKNKNINFIGLSIDKQKYKKKWLAMVESKKLKGLQILADKDYDSAFIKAYKIKGIPRFILIDPEGKIVNSRAPRPSYDEEIRALLDSLPL